MAFRKKDNISFLNRCVLPTAEDMNLFIMMTVSPSKGRGKPPNSNIIFCCLSKLLIKCDIWVPSDGLQAISFWLRFDQRDSKLSLKLERCVMFCDQFRSQSWAVNLTACWEHIQCTFKTQVGPSFQKHH